MKIIFFIFTMVLLNSAQAQNHCSAWTEKRGYTCALNGEFAQIWERQCEITCNGENYPKCDLTRICYNEDPNKLAGPCSEWISIQGTTCANQTTHRFEQKWTRVCQTPLATSACSDTYPAE